MLEPVGVGPDEERVYSLLVTRTRMRIDELAAATELDPARAAALADSLVERGLVRRAAGPEHEYLLAPPEPAIEALVAHRMEQLQRVRTLAIELADKARRSTSDIDPARLVEVVSGEGAVRHVFLQLIRSARHELCTFDRPPYAVDPAETDPMQAERLTSGLRLRTVFDRSLVDDPPHLQRILRGVDAGEQARLGVVPLKLAMADGEVVILPLLHEGEETPEAVVIVRRSVLLDSLVALFEAVWREAVPVGPRRTSQRDDPDDATKDDTRELVRLLAAGMTDGAIARHLGVSERTVRRRVKTLLEELRVDTRFQAAVRAVERDWL